MLSFFLPSFRRTPFHCLFAAVTLANVDFLKGKLCFFFPFSFRESETTYFRGSSENQARRSSSPVIAWNGTRIPRPYGVIQACHASFPLSFVPFVVFEVRNRSGDSIRALHAARSFFLWISCLIYQAMKVVSSHREFSLDLLLVFFSLLRVQSDAHTRPRSCATHGGSRLRHCAPGTWAKRTE